MNMTVPHYFVELPMRELKTLEGNVIHVNVIIFKLQQKCGATHELYERIKYRYNIKYTPKTTTCNNSCLRYNELNFNKMKGIF